MTIVRRTPAGWDEAERRGGERVTLPEPSLDFALDDLYAGRTGISIP